MRSVLPLTIAWNQMIAGAVLLPTALAGLSVAAEKLPAIAALGDANNRTKDFDDIWSLSKSAAVDGDRLASAIAATQKRWDSLPTL